LDKEELLKINKFLLDDYEALAKWLYDTAHETCEQFKEHAFEMNSCEISEYQ
jgi:hypothetical protein